MTDEKDADRSMTQGGVEPSARDGETVAAHPLPDQSATKRPQRDPTHTLAACERILVVQAEPGRADDARARTRRCSSCAPRRARLVVFRPGVQHSAPASTARADERCDCRRSLGHRRQQASGARSCLAPGGYARLARLSPEREPAEARKTGAPRTWALKAQARRDRRNTGLPRQFLAAAKGYSRRSDHTRGSAASTPGCSPSRRTSTSRWCASGHRAQLESGWLASRRGAPQRRRPECTDRPSPCAQPCPIPPVRARSAHFSHGPVRRHRPPLPRRPRAGDGPANGLVRLRHGGARCMPPILEPLFQNLDASIRVTPVMNGEDLQRGLKEAGK